MQARPTNQGQWKKKTVKQEHEQAYTTYISVGLKYIVAHPWKMLIFGRCLGESDRQDTGMMSHPSSRDGMMMMMMMMMGGHHNAPAQAYAPGTIGGYAGYTIDGVYYPDRKSVV